MNEFGLQIRGYDSSLGAERVRPVFVWNRLPGLRQFTLEMAKDEAFRQVVFLRDTHECYYAYDSVKLKADTVYHIRVRSGMGAWSMASFRTGMEE